MFTITKGKGFHLLFANGYGISVQWGTFNYCEHHDSWDADARMKALRGSEQHWQSKDAEVAILHPVHGISQVPGITDEWGDDMCGYLTADEVADLIAKVKALPKP